MGSLFWGELEGLDREVVPAKAVDERPAPPSQTELLDDVLLDDGCGSGRDRDDRSWTKHRQPLAQQSVVRAKIVAPLGDAVRLVNGDERGLAPGEQLRKAR